VVKYERTLTIEERRTSIYGSMILFNEEKTLEANRGYNKAAISLMLIDEAIKQISKYRKSGHE
jgi:hypothetical protein